MKKTGLQRIRDVSVRYLDSEWALKVDHLFPTWFAPENASETRVTKVSLWIGFGQADWAR